MLFLSRPTRRVRLLIEPRPLRSGILARCGHVGELDRGSGLFFFEIGPSEFHVDMIPGQFVEHLVSLRQDQIDIQPDVGDRTPPSLGIEVFGPSVHSRTPLPGPSMKSSSLAIRPSAAFALPAALPAVGVRAVVAAIGLADRHCTSLNRYQEKCFPIKPAYPGKNSVDPPSL